MKEEQPKNIRITGVLATLTAFVLLLALGARLADYDLPGWFDVLYYASLIYWAFVIGLVILVIIIGIVYAFVNEFRDKQKDSASE